MLIGTTCIMVRPMRRKIGVVGLGYVGLPVAAAFGEVQPVVGYDVNTRRIAALQHGIDETGELSLERLRQTNIVYTSDPQKLQNCDFIIITVPTPIDLAKQPDLSALKKASQTVGEQLREGTIVVYESTVYPGLTEEICIPILEKCSGKKAGKDFFVGYSPERINPGDKQHSFKQIVKVVAGQTQVVCDIIADVYGMVVEAGIYRAPSIQVAEAAKVIENTQRDLNIALINELAVIFDRMGIDTGEVLAAAGTKWNFLPFKPGLVGGHCISVDPYYLTFKAESMGYHPQVILAGRRINDQMGKFIATSLVKQMILSGIQIQGSRVTILGLTFKENVPDIRNSRVIDIITELREFGIHTQVTDDFVQSEVAENEYGITLVPWEHLQPAQAVVLAVCHERYVRLCWEELAALLVDRQGVIVDVKSIMDAANCPPRVRHWRL